MAETVIELQLLAFWTNITQFPTTTPGGWYDNTTYFFNDPSSYRTQVLVEGISQAILEFRREDHKTPDQTKSGPFDYITNTTYPTSVTTLNLLEKM
jgi:hypothetical protein